MTNPLVEKVREIVAPPVQSAGYELVDVEWKHEQGGWILRAYIDGPGGIGHEDCERVSRELSAVLDVNDAIPHAYSLEVSSPGLNRPLRTAAHFAAQVGERAKIKLVKGLEGRRNFAGTIRVVEGNDVTVEVDGKDYVLPLADLEKANLEYRFDKPSSRALKDK